MLDNDQILRVKALHAALNAQHAGPKAIETAKVVAAAKSFYKFLSEKPDVASKDGPHVA